MCCCCCVHTNQHSNESPTCNEHGHEVVPQLLVIGVSSTHVNHEAKQGGISKLRVVCVFEAKGRGVQAGEQGRVFGAEGKQPEAPVGQN